MKAASAGECVVATGCAQEHWCLLMSSRTWGDLSCKCCWSFHGDIACYHYSVFLSQHHNRQWLWGRPTFISAVKDSRITLSSAAFFPWIHSQVLTQKRLKPHWKKVTVHLRHYWENNVKCVINRFKNSLSALFDGVPELIVKWSVQFSTNPLVLIFHLFFLTGYFPNT